MESLHAAVKHVAKPGDVIIDFCAGGVSSHMLIVRVYPKTRVNYVYYPCPSPKPSTILNESAKSSAYLSSFTSIILQGHVGILAAHLLPECQVILVETKAESIRRALNRIESLQLKNILIYQVSPL